METLDLQKFLEENSYCGRGIIVGKSPDGKNAVMAYFTMGRSENSRNRVFIETVDGIKIEAFDPSKLEDPSLIIYNPVRKIENKIIVTNGDQTDTIYDFLERGKSFETALATRCFEPDAPNFTPRISAVLNVESSFNYTLSILKAGDGQGSVCNRYFYNYEPLDGIGHFIHTYEQDGNPLPSFKGEPKNVQTLDNIDEFTSLLWINLSSDNKVSLYVSYLSLETGKRENRILNKLS